MTDHTIDMPDFRLPDPRGILTTLYGAGATSWRDLSQKLSVPFYKIGLSSRCDVRKRYVDLSERRYGAVIAPMNDREATIFNHERGKEVFGSRFPDPIDNAKVAALMTLLPHAEYRSGVVQFRLAPAIDLTALEQRFQAILSPRNLNNFLASKTGQARLVQAGYPANSRLFSDYDTQGHAVDSLTLVRRSLCSELFCIRPQYELGIILQALVQAIREAMEIAASNAALK